VSQSDTPYEGLPVAGYRPQTERSVGAVNGMKATEEAILRVLDKLGEDESIDQRWLAIGRTQIEQGFMAVNRSIFKPERVALPGEHHGTYGGRP